MSFDLLWMLCTCTVETNNTPLSDRIFNGSQALHGMLPSCVVFCSFNQLDLPAYETYDKLRSQLLIAIRECPEGFGFA